MLEDAWGAAVLEGHSTAMASLPFPISSPQRLLGPLPPLPRPGLGTMGAPCAAAEGPGWDREVRGVSSSGGLLSYWVARVCAAWMSGPLCQVLASPRSQALSPAPPAVWRRWLGPWGCS